MSTTGKDPTSTGDETRHTSGPDQVTANTTATPDDTAKHGRGQGRGDQTASKLSPRKSLHKLRAQLALAGATYEEIARATGSKARPGPPHDPTLWQRQSVYNSLHSPGGQRALAEVLDYTEQDVKTRLAQVIQHFSPANPKQAHMRGLELAARVKGMVRDVQEVTVNTTVLSVSVETGAREALARLGLEPVDKADIG